MSLPSVDNFIVGSIININNTYYELNYDNNNNKKIWKIDEDYNNLNYYNDDTSDEDDNDDNTEIYYKNIKINFDTKKKKIINNLKNTSSVLDDDKVFIIKEKKPRGRPPKNTKLNIQNLVQNNKENIILKKVVKKLINS